MTVTHSPARRASARADHRPRGSRPARRLRRALGAAVAAVLALTLTACLSTDPTSTEATAGRGRDGTIVIGSANFPESDILGHIYAEALEEAGFDAEVSSGIGSREGYTSALESGDVDVFPEYLGALAVYYGVDVAPGTGTEELAGQAAAALPAGLAIARPAPGENADSFRVLPGTAREHGLHTLADLAKLDRVRWAANPEITGRSFNAEGMERVYGVPADSIEYRLISDSGGPLTVTALRDGQVDVANIFTTSPALDSDGDEVDTVTLEDPEGLVNPENVTPLYRADALPEKAVSVLDRVSAALTTERLREFNLRSVGDERAEPAEIARDFVESL